METRIITISSPSGNEAELLAAGRALAEGALVVFPTETVYGLGASAFCRQAIDQLSSIKQRTPDKPFTFHLADPSEAEQYAGPLPLVAQRLIKKAWPGPLTLVVPDARPRQGEPAGLVEEAIYYHGTVGLRCPSHAACRAVLRAAGVPVVATSANPAGMPAPCSAADALAYLNGKVSLVIDAGPTQHGHASTVVRVTADNAYEVLREGTITARRVERMSVTRILLVCTGNLCRSPMAEGLARKMLGDRLRCSPDDLWKHGLDVSSAGTGASPGLPASENARQAMAEHGIDIGHHRSRPLTVDALLAADYIWVMTQGHRESVLRLAPEVASRVAPLDPSGRDVPDPIGGDIDAYRACAARLEQALAARLAEVT